MRFSCCLAGVLCLALIGECNAQLEVQNNGDQVVVMKYLRLANFGQQMKEVQIGGNSWVRIPLDGPDPYMLSFHRQGEDDQVGIHAKAGELVPLNRWAASGDRYVIQDHQAAANVNGQTRYQTTAAHLGDSNGNRARVISHPEDASQFLKGVVNSRWNTAYRALNGSDRGGIAVDFKNLRYGNEGGTFTDVLITEDDQACYICGRWSYGQQVKGDVFFKITKNDPNRLTGHYFQDGDRRTRLNWSGNR